MALLLGVTLLYLAALSTMSFRFALNRTQAPRWLQGEGPANSAAFAITALIAYGVALIGGALLADWSLASAVAAGGALLALAVAVAGTWTLLRRAAPATPDTHSSRDASVIPFTAPGDGAPHRPGPSRGHAAKRAA